MTQLPSPNSINNVEILHLSKIRYPGEDTDSYCLPAVEVQKVLDAGKIPEIRLKETYPGPKIAVILAQNKHPDRAEKDYYLNPEVSEHIIEAGGNPVFVAFDKLTEQLEHWQPEGILLIGGAFNTPREWYVEMPEEDTDKRGFAYLEMVEYAKKHKLPTLGLCAGYQVMAGMHGAKLLKNINEGKTFSHKQGGRKPAHKISIKKGSLLEKILETDNLIVNSDHNEAVFSQQPGDCIITAWAEDGIAEAIELKKPWHPFVIGVQWHPECHYDSNQSDGKKLFKAFVDEAKRVK